MRALMAEGRSFWAAHFLTFGHVWPRASEVRMIRDALFDAGLLDVPMCAKSYQPQESAPFSRSSRFDARGDHGFATLEDVARDLGVSRERARQIERTALQKLRRSLETETFQVKNHWPECLRGKAYL